MPTISYPLENEDREAVRLLLDTFGEIWPESHWGPLHILIEDYNALDHNLEFCRRAVYSALGSDPKSDMTLPQNLKHSEIELKASLLLLDMLALIPEDQRDIHAEAVDNE